MGIKAKIEGDNLVLTIELQPATPSKSGKTKIVATTNGFVPTTVKVNGEVVSVSVNAFIK